MTHFGNSTLVFLWQPWKFHFFFNWPLELPHALSSIPLEILCPHPPLPPPPHLPPNVWIFSGIAHWNLIVHLHITTYLSLLCLLCSNNILKIFWQDLLFPFLFSSFRILKAHFSKHKSKNYIRIIKAQNPYFDKNFKAHWNIDILK